jgi:excisionase family DNA binding protein
MTTLPIDSLRTEMLLSMSSCSLIADLISERIAPDAKRYSDPHRSPWMRTDEASAYLRIGKSELHRLAAAGAIPHEQDGGPGGRLFFHCDDLDEWRRAGGRRS